jgi:hypothetical protein
MNPGWDSDEIELNPETIPLGKPLLGNLEQYGFLIFYHPSIDRLLYFFWGKFFFETANSIS